MSEFQLGVVRWFNPQKRFGFIRDVRGGPDIFFHYNDGRFIGIKDGELVYNNSKEGTYSLPDPRLGDNICFEYAEGSKGRPKASPWGYENDLEQTSQEWEEGKEICQSCFHREWDHAGALCMVSGCHCGDEVYEHEDDEPREVNLGDSPGGFKIYE